MQNLQLYVIEMVYINFKGWSDVKKVMIVQEGDCLECVLPCCCEGANKYIITTLDENDNPQRQLAYLSESSGFGSRCCCQCFRGFKMNMSTDKDAEFEVKADKGCGCTCTPAMCMNFSLCCVCINGCPFLRPSIAVSNKNEVIGRVDNLFRVCGRTGCKCCPFDEIDIIDKSGNMKYMISASCCQLGQCSRLALCPCRCCVGKNISFGILNAQQEEVGRITNIYNGCYKELCTKEDKFVIEFPANANYDEKILLVYGTIMIDFDIFEDTCCHLC